MAAKKKDNNEQTDNQEKIVDLNTEDVVIEEPVDEISPLDKAMKELEDNKNSMLRMQADFENYKKRNKDLTSKMYAMGVTDAVCQLFPVLDSLDLAITMYKSDKEKEGIELVIKKFLSAFEALGVKEIEAEGTDFNPEYHEAVSRTPGEQDNSGKVAEVYRKGYIFKDKILRPAMVRIYE